MIILVYIDIVKQNKVSFHNYSITGHIYIYVLSMQTIFYTEYCMFYFSLDEEHTKLVLKELAKFHSTGVAVKHSYPDLFKQILLSVGTPALQNEDNPNKEKIDKEFRNTICESLKSMSQTAKFAAPVCTMLMNIDKTKVPVPSEPYATILHNDLWNGNILFRYSCRNEPVEVKFIDFQTTMYNSPARDLVYFLYTSVKDEVLDDFTELVRFYYYTFTQHLVKLGVSAVEFSFQELLQQIDVYGPTKLKHIMQLFYTRCREDANYNNKFEFELQRLMLLFHKRGWI